MKLFRKKNHEHTELSSGTGKILSKPTATDILRYRYHNGTNLGSIYVLEKWLSPCMFEKIDGIGGSEHDAVLASLSTHGLSAIKLKWEHHWQKAVTPENWKWLKETAHCTTIRLPIGYYTLGPSFCHGTPFDGDIAKVYTNAWASVKNLVHTASSHGIGILLDLHALPGGANASPHSGTSSKVAALWTDSSARKRATECVRFIAREAAADEKFANGLVGIQVVNEAKYKAPGLFEWYASVLDAVAEVEIQIPVYVSDAWDLGAVLSWAQKRNARPGGRNPVVVDTHKYFCFGGPNAGLNPNDIIEKKIPELFTKIDASHRKLTSVVVGEWSCVLGEKSWEKVGKEERGSLTKKYGVVQSRRWYEETSGSFFWTWKMDWMPGGGWGFTKQINEGNIVVPPGLLLSSEERAQRVSYAQGKFEERYKDAGIRYWERNEKIFKKLNVLGYTQGWKDGWNDSIFFFEGHGDIIGLLGAWTLKRMREIGGGTEWVEGFQDGVGCFREVTGV